MPPSDPTIEQNNSAPEIIVSRSSIRRSGTGRSPTRQTRSRLPVSSPPTNRQRVAAVAALHSKVHKNNTNGSDEEVDSSRKSSRVLKGRPRGRQSSSRERREDSQRSSSRGRNSRHTRSRSLNQPRSARNRASTLDSFRSKDGDDSRFAPEAQAHKTPLTPPRQERDRVRNVDRSKKSKSPRVRTVGRAKSDELPLRISQSPTRSLSNDPASDLSTFFSQNASISRRPKPKGASKSVTTPRPMIKTKKNRRASLTGASSNDFDAKVTNTGNKETEDPEEASDIDSETEEFHKDQVHDSQQSFPSARDMESALQRHMNRTDNLLYSVFPKHIAEDLRAGRKVEPQNHEIVTIFFSDVIGFTDISSTLDPLKVSDLLDRLYHSLDALSHYHDVFKVETIGDAYMAVTNLAKHQPDHCKRIAEFSIDAIRVAQQTLIDTDNPEKGFVNLRVGFHSGPVVSNVVGSRNPRYCLFGDTVNTASRMESNSQPSRIHCSETAANLLQEQAPQIKLFPRGSIAVKGKGDMNTFWVNKEGENENLVSDSNGDSSRFSFKPFRNKH